MRSDSPPDPDQPDPDAWLKAFEPGAPYGVYPEPPGLRRLPWMTDEDMVDFPRGQPGQSPAEAAGERLAYIAAVAAKRGIAWQPPPGTEKLLKLATRPAAPAAGTPPQPAPAQPAESAATAFAADAAPAGSKPAAPPASPAVAESAGPSRPPSPRPLKPRHERFCINYLLLGNATRAAWAAGYSSGSGHNQAYRLLKRPEIQARIAELQRGLARGFAGDAEALLGKLESVYRQAIEAERYNAAVRVVELQARMAGHLKSRARLPALAAAEPENDEK